MASEETIGQRILETIKDVHERYDRTADNVRMHVPTVVKIAEGVLAVALFAMLAYWLFLYFG